MAANKMVAVQVSASPYHGYNIEYRNDHEINILNYLKSKPGVIVTRRELSEAIGVYKHSFTIYRAICKLAARGEISCYRVKWVPKKNVSDSQYEAGYMFVKSAVNYPCK